MTRLRWTSCVAALCATGLVPAAAEPAAVEAPRARLERTVGYLAAPELEGRPTGGAGEERAARFVADELARLGARPLPGRDGFLMPFEFTAGAKDVGSTLEITTGEGPAESMRGATQVQALSFSDQGSASGSVVFAGYGLVVPESEGGGLDSYAGLDVKDKVVLVLRYSPEDVDADRRAQLARYSGLRYKALHARERGAKALLVVTGPRSPNAGETVPMTFDAAIGGSGILAASVSGAVAAKLFAAHAGQSLEQLQQALDTGNPHITGFEIPGLRVALDVRVERERGTGRNVVGVLPARGAAAADSYVVLGAHLDHLGRGQYGDSLARKEEHGQPHLGADDNASGVAAVLLAADILARRDLARPVVLGFWTGEEIGLLGSTQFMKVTPVPAERMWAYLNFDMVGRMKEDVLSAQGVGSSPAWPRILEQSNVAAGFDLRLLDDPYLPTDATAFYLAGVPTLHFFTGAHEDYHRPSDSADKIRYGDLERVARFGAAVAARLAALDARPEYVKVQPKERPGAREGLRAFTGTIPDYTAEVDGLRLSGVVEGGPAQQAGLREGDVIVEFGGMRIANVYDYTHALERAKIGQPVKVVYLRAGERGETTLTPAARK